MGMTLFPSIARLALPLMNKQKLDPKDSTYNSLECEEEKKGSEVKSENFNTIHAKNCLHRGMWNGSTIWQNPAYVDALSNPFTQ
jgi:hypothetical protein